MPRAALFFCAPASAQQLSFGVKAGINFSTATVEPEAASLDYGYQKGWLGGVFVVVSPDAPLGGQIEALYSQRGTAIKVGSSGNLDAAYKLSFIDVPLLLRVRAASFDNGGLFILAGPVIGIGVKSETEQSGSRTDVSDRFNAYDLSLAIGAAMESQGFVFDVRYAHGLNNYSNGSHPAVETFKGRAATVSIGIRF